MSGAKNGNGTVLKWMLGIATTVIAALLAAGIVWTIGSIFHCTSKIALIESRLYGIEEVNKAQETELRNIKRLLQERKQ